MYFLRIRQYILLICIINYTKNVSISIDYFLKNNFLLYLLHLA